MGLSGGARSCSAGGFGVEVPVRLELSIGVGVIFGSGVGVGVDVGSGVDVGVGTMVGVGDDVGVGVGVGVGVDVGVRVGVGVGVPDTTVPVIVLPVLAVIALVLFPRTATCVALVKITDDCLAASIFIVHVPMMPAPLNGLVGWTPRVTAIAPLVCVSGTRTTGRGVPVEKLTIWIAVGS